MGYIGDYTTQLFRDYNKPLQGSLLINHILESDKFFFVAQIAFDWHSTNLYLDLPTGHQTRRITEQVPIIHGADLQDLERELMLDAPWEIPKSGDAETRICSTHLICIYYTYNSKYKFNIIQDT